MSGPAITSRTPVDLEDFEARLRRAQPSQDPHSDPLAELARLVEGQRLPFSKLQAPRPQPQQAMQGSSDLDRGHQGHPEPDWALRGPISDIHADARGPYGAPDLSAGRERAPDPFARNAYEQGDYGQAPYAEPTAVPPPPGAWRQEDAVWENDPAPKRRSRLAVFALGGALCVVLAGVGGTYALRGGPAVPSNAPTIKAATGPLKVAPEAPAQSTAPANAASVLDKAGEKIGASRVVTTEEQPVDLSQVRTASIPARAASPFPEPIRVKTVSVRPDGTIISAMDAPARPAAAAVTPPPAPQRTASNVTGSTPPATAPASPAARAPVAPVAAAPTSSPAPAAPQAKTTARVSPPSEAPAPRPIVAASATPAQASTPTVAKGGFAVQLAAAGSDAEARDRIGKYQRQYAAALDGHMPGVVQGEANGKQVWRIRVGGLSREDAVSMCVSIKDSGGSCFVATN